MPLSALALALGAALLHAAWNVLLAGARDSSAATGALLVCGVLLLAPAAIVTGGVESAALPFIAASAALEIAYFGLLAAAYGGGELSAVYPVARGSAPVIVLIAAAIALGEEPSAAATAGIVAVALGVILVRAPRERRPGRDLLFGLAIGAVIASYTVVDAEGIEHARPLAYLELALLPCALAYCGTLILTGRGAELRTELGPRAALTALLVFGAYTLVLAALDLSAAAPVAAVRESSVVIAVIMAAVFLHEPVRPRRVAGAVVVAAGVAAIALG